jgi:hypothetical protein
VIRRPKKNDLGARRFQMSWKERIDDSARSKALEVRRLREGRSMLNQDDAFGADTAGEPSGQTVRGQIPALLQLRRRKRQFRRHPDRRSSGAQGGAQVAQRSGRNELWLDAAYGESELLHRQQSHVMPGAIVEGHGLLRAPNFIGEWAAARRDDRASATCGERGQPRTKMLLKGVAAAKLDDRQRLCALAR